MKKLPFKKTRVKKSKHRAFTLIELLVVIAIIGILATVLMVAINPAKRMQQARDATRKADLNSLQKALELYYFDKGTYPSTGGYCCTSWVYNNNPEPWIPGLDSQYLKVLPKDPKNNGAGPWTDGNYTYAYSSNGPHYNLVAQLEDHTDKDRCEVKNYLWIISDSETTQGICGPPAGPNGIATVYIYLRTSRQ